MALTKASYAMVTGAPINVLDFGADNTGVNDSTAAFNLAIAQGAHKIIVPAGTYKITESLSDLNNSQIIQGEGSGVSILNIIGSGYDVFTLTSDYASITDIQFTSPDVRTSGKYIKIISTNVKSVIHNRVENFEMYKAHYGIYTGGPNTVFTVIRNGLIKRLASPSGIGIMIDGGSDQFIDSILVDGVYTRDEIQSTAGLLIKESGAAWVSNCDFVRSGNGVSITPGTGQKVSFLFFQNVATDTCTNNGFDIIPSNTGEVIISKFVNCWSGTCKNGIYLAKPGTGRLAGISFYSHRCVNNYDNGVLVSGCNDFTFNNSSIISSGLSSVNTFSGIDISSSNFQICNNTIVDSQGGYAATPAYGILIGGATTNLFNISNNIIQGSATANLLNQSTAADFIIKDNLGASTETKGQTQINAGQTSVTITHGLIAAPAVVVANVLNANIGSVGYYISNITSTTFTINLTSSVGGNVGFSYQASCYVK